MEIRDEDSLRTINKKKYSSDCVLSSKVCHMLRCPSVVDQDFIIAVLRWKQGVGSWFCGLHLCLHFGLIFAQLSAQLEEQFGDFLGNFFALS